MNHEQLSRSVERADKQAQLNAKEEEKTQARLAQKNARRQERLAPYWELEHRNRAVFERADMLAKALPAVCGPHMDYPWNSSTFQHHVNVVIGEADNTPTTPDHMIVAQVITSDWKYNDKPRKNATFHFVGVDKNTAQTLQEDCLDRSIVERRNNYRTLAEERTLIIGHMGVLSVNIDGRVSDRAFSPIRAVRRATHLAGLNRYLAGLENTMNMIDAAARNPQLNPSLAHLLKEAPTAEQQAQG